jgi:Putative beta-barrel porin 2
MLVRLSCLGIIAALSLLAASRPVAAQEWLADRQRAEGRGIRLGNFELHPGIGSEVGYDSNVFLSDSEDEQDSMVLRVAPHVYLSTLSGERLQGEEPRFTLRTGVSGSLRHYFATDAGTDMAVGQDLTFAWNATSIFRLEIYDVFIRSIDPFTEPLSPAVAGGVQEDINYGRDQLGAGLRLQLSSPGRLIKAGLGYRIDFDHFEDVRFASNRGRTHTISADDSWEFLPKTALFWNGTIAFHQFVHPEGAIGDRDDGTIVSSKIGINGALTQRIGFTVAAGYGAGFFDDDNDYENVLAQVELRWKPQENLLWAIGYDRESNPSFQGNFANMDRVKTRVQAFIGGVFVLAANADLTFVDFGRDDELQQERNDVQLLTKLSGEYRIVDWFAITGQLGYLQNFTDFDFALDDPDGDDLPLAGGVDAPELPNGTGGDDPIFDSAAYKRFEAWLGVRAFL